MTAHRTDLPDHWPMTVQDLEQLPDDGNRYELDDGVLVVSPAPAFVHQVVVTRLTGLLLAVCPQDMLVVSGPRVEMSPTQYRIPDLVVVRADAVDISGVNVMTPPLLAIEVASPSTAIYDRSRKRDVYAAFGIASFWIVSPSLDKPTVTAFALQGGALAEVAHVAGEDHFRATVPFPVEIVPSELVAGPWQR